MILPGFARFSGGPKPPFFIAATGGAHVSAGGASSITLTIPAETRDGDLMVCWMAANGTDTRTIGLPAGWTHIGGGNHNGTSVPSARAFYRFKQPGDVSVTCTATTSYRAIASMQVWRGAQIGSNTYTVPAQNNRTWNQIASVDKGSALALFAHTNVPVSFSTTISINDLPSPTQLAYKTNSGGVGGAAHWSGYELGLPAGATGTRVFTDTASFDVFAAKIMIEIKRA